MRIDKNHVIEAFKKYTDSYNSQDPKILLKIRHTYRVAGLCERIARFAAGLDCTAGRENENIAETSTGTTTETSVETSTETSAEISVETSTETSADPETVIDPDFAWLCGMLHDIGRFEQVRRYGTFSDALSVDHAQLGADLLFNENLLETFVPLPQQCMSAEELAILELSIRSHSLFRIPEGLTQKEQAYCNILRDADKVDIFRVNCDTPPEDIYNVTTDGLRNSEVSPAVKQCFLNKTAVLRSLKKTPVDFLAGHICLYFELVYDISRQITWQQGYLQKMLDFDSENAETREWFSYMKAHIRESEN